MNILKTSLISAALLLGTSTAAFAQTSAIDKAKDVAIDKGTEMAKDKAEDLISGVVPGAVAPKEPSLLESVTGSSSSTGDILGGVTGGSSAVGSVLGGVAGGSSAGGLTSTTLSGDETVTAGKVLLKGGSKEDAAMAVAKDRLKTKVKDSADGVLNGDAPSYGSSTSAPAAAPSYGSSTSAPAAAPSYGSSTAAPAASAIAVNCPAGTTAQSDGSCMITGNYTGQ